MKKRLPWLIVLLGMGIGVSAVVGLFEEVVNQIAVIVCFQSLILGMAGNAGTQSLAVTVRVLSFEALERKADFLKNAAYEGSYGEDWSLRKMLRRFIWHDRIHAKAMYRMATKLFGTENIENPFCF